MTVVCFLPGMMCDRQLWQQVWPHLPAEWELRYIPMEQCADRAEILALLRECIGGDAVHMVGFSMGGYVALEYALEQPDAYRSLSLVGASAFGLPTAERERRLKYLPMLAQGGYKGISRHRLAQFVHPDRLDDAEVAGVVRQMDARLGKETLIRQITSGSTRESFLEELPRLTMPVLLAGAEQDAVIKPSSLRKMTEYIPDVQLHLFAETGHMIPLERPQELAAVLRGFITAVA